MTFRYRTRFFVLLTLLLASTGRAQTPEGCLLGRATTDLAANDVRARLFNNGGLFWKGAGNVYNVPAVPTGQPITPNAIFAAGIWVGGEVNGEPRMVAADYGNWELWPGPLDASGNPPADCTPYDRIFTITTGDLAAYEHDGTVSDDLRDWPWQWGAPVVDGDGNPDNYDLAGGDRPEVLGHETHWWVMNDAAGLHSTTGTPPIGMEVQVTAYAASSGTMEAINQTTFYRYKLIYRGYEPPPPADDGGSEPLLEQYSKAARSSQPLEDAYFTYWNDPDLGNATDDWVGSDTTLDMGFIYNADNNDEGSDGYGGAPPALGVTFLKGLNGETSDRQMSVFLVYGSITAPYGNPRNNTTDFYNFMRGFWQDGKPMLDCGNGYDPTGLACAATAQPTKFMWPGDPVTGQGWSEPNFDRNGTPQPPNDRRFIMSTGPFTMQPGETKEVVFAIVWARGIDNIDSVGKLREATRTVRETWRQNPSLSGFAPPPPPTTAPVPQAVRRGEGRPDLLLLSWTATPAVRAYSVQVRVASLDTTFIAGSNDTALDLAGLVEQGRLLPGSRGQWRVRAATLGGVGPWSAWQDLSISPPTESVEAFRILSVAPRPARARTRVTFAVGTAASVRLSLYDVLGRRVRVLTDQPMFEGGPYEATLDAAVLAPGVYFLRLEAGGVESHTEPLVVVR